MSELVIALFTNIYHQEVLAVLDSKYGLHFDASQMTEEKIHPFDMREIRTKMKLIVP